MPDSSAGRDGCLSCAVVPKQPIGGGKRPKSIFLCTRS
jgi:hypothetical protein